MAWKRVRKDEKLYAYSKYDIVVRKRYVYIPVLSKLRDDLENSGMAYDIYYDREEGKVGIVPNKNGEYKVPSDYVISVVHGRYTRPLLVILDVLGVGKYVAELGDMDGKLMYVFKGGSRE